MRSIFCLALLSGLAVACGGSNNGSGGAMCSIENQGAPNESCNCVTSSGIVVLCVKGEPCLAACPSTLSCCYTTTTGMVVSCSCSDPSAAGSDCATVVANATKAAGSAGTVAQVASCP